MKQEINIPDGYKLLEGSHIDFRKECVGCDGNGKDVFNYSVVVYLKPKKTELWEVMKDPCYKQGYMENFAKEQAELAKQWMVGRIIEYNKSQPNYDEGNPAIYITRLRDAIGYEEKG